MPLISQDVSNYIKIVVEEPGTTEVIRTLQQFLPQSVQLYALSILERGGLSAQDFAWAEQNGPKLDLAPLFSGDKQISNSEQFNIIAKALAILAHFPQGVSLFGMHFEVDHMYRQQRSAKQSS